MLKKLKDRLKHMINLYVFLGIVTCVATGLFFINRSLPSDSVLNLKVFERGSGSKSGSLVSATFFEAYGLHLIFSVAFLLTIAIKLTERSLKKPEQSTPMLKDNLHLLILSVSIAAIIISYVLNQFIRLSTNTL